MKRGLAIAEKDRMLYTAILEGLKKGKDFKYDKNIALAVKVELKKVFYLKVKKWADHKQV